MATEKQFIGTCRHCGRIATLGARWCKNGYEQYLYECGSKCPGYEPVGKIEITTTETKEETI